MKIGIPTLLPRLQLNWKPMIRLPDALGASRLEAVSILQAHAHWPEQTGFYIAASALLVVISGLCAGLTLGLLSLDRCGGGSEGPPRQRAAVAVGRPSQPSLNFLVFKIHKLIN